MGASGAIFGIAGILIVLLSNRKLAIPWEELKSLRRQVILFAVINLALGIAPQFSPSLTAAEWARLHVNPRNIPHIDNSAHLGGLLSGLALGVPLLSKMTTGKASYRAQAAGDVCGGGAVFVAGGVCPVEGGQGLKRAENDPSKTCLKAHKSALKPLQNRS